MRVRWDWGYARYTWGCRWDGIGQRDGLSDIDGDGDGDGDRDGDGDGDGIGWCTYRVRRHFLDQNQKSLKHGIREARTNTGVLKKALNVVQDDEAHRRLISITEYLHHHHHHHHHHILHQQTLNTASHTL